MHLIIGIDINRRQIIVNIYFVEDFLSTAFCQQHVVDKTFDCKILEETVLVFKSNNPSFIDFTKYRVLKSVF